MVLGSRYNGSNQGTGVNHSDIAVYARTFLTTDRPEPPQAPSNRGDIALLI